MVQRPDGSVQLRFDELQRVVRREPSAQRLAGCLPEAPQLGAPPRDVRRFVEQDQVERQVVEVVAAAVQVGRAALNRLVRDRRLARGGDERADRALQEVLIDAAVLVEQSQRRLEPVRERLALRMRQALVVDAPNPVHDADMAGLREERRVVDESPERQEAVHAARIAVVAEDAADAHHDATSTSTRSCLPGS